MIVGNRKEATDIAVAWANAVRAHARSDQSVTDQLPEGWTYIGEGSWREVFRGPSGTVYKVPTRYAMREYGPPLAHASQFKEYRTLRYFRNKNWAPDVSLCRIRVSGYGVVPVVAMPFIKGDRKKLTKQGRQELREIRSLIDDSGWGEESCSNTKIVAGRPVCVDAGGAH